MAFRIYKSYSFKDKDPVIDTLRTVLKDSKKSYQEVHEASGVAVSTIYNWFDGPTLRPTHATVAAFAGALGYHFILMPRRRK